MIFECQIKKKVEKIYGVFFKLIKSITSNCGI